MPIGLAPGTGDEAVVRVYELLARSVGPNDPIFYRHPITTWGQLSEVGLLYVAAAESDGDLLHLLAAKGAAFPIRSTRLRSAPRFWPTGPASSGFCSMIWGPTPTRSRATPTTGIARSPPPGGSRSQSGGDPIGPRRPGGLPTKSERAGRRTRS